MQSNQKTFDQLFLVINFLIIHLFNKHLLSTYYVPDALLKDTRKNKC